MTITETIVLMIAIGLTALLTWLLLKAAAAKKLAVAHDRIEQCTTQLNALAQQQHNLQQEKEMLLQQTARAEAELGFLTEQYALLKRYQKEHEVLQNQLAMFKEKYRSAEEKMQHQQKETAQLGEHFKFEFRNLAQAILEEKSEKFTKLNETQLNLLLTPLRSQLTDFKQKVEETYDKESKERFSLGKEVQRLIEMSQLVSQEANNLTTALKGNHKLQGNWGEMILESLLESSGLSKGREYHVQEFIRDNAGNIVKDEQGKGLQPDVTIQYPDQRKLIIDSKVSLIAWDQYIACNEAQGQQECLKEHIRSIKSHIDSLSRKNYPRYALALDYVLLFVPIEPAFLEAIKADVQLWKYAYDKKILLVSPTNLLSVLKIISDLWKTEQQNQHAAVIAEKAGALYEKFYGFIENLESVGKKITEANTAYDAAFRQLASGRGNLITRVEELKKLGAATSKQLPDRLLQ